MFHNYKMTIFDETSYQITLNKTNLVENNQNNNVFRYRFPGTASFKDTKIALSQCSTFYSWRNITARFENNTFQYIWTDGSGSSTHTVLFPDGFYSVSNLNTFLQSVMISNGHYLVNDNGDNVYYLELIENPTFYSVQLNVFPFPTALPALWTNPNSLTFPASPSTPQFVIPNNNFAVLIGYIPDTYPSTIQTTTQSFLSNTTPQLNTISNIILSCNLVNNRYANPTSILFSFNAAGVQYGGLIDSSPNEVIFYDVQEGSYQFVEITFLDQTLNAVQLLDPDVIITLVFKSKKPDM
jgi:hypothetical protein